MPARSPSFSTVYPRIIYIGLLSIVWFGALCRAAHDLWAASWVFAALTALTVLFLAGRARDGLPIKCPAATPIAFLLAVLNLSLSRSFDISTTQLDLWSWFFIFLAFYLWINVVETEDDAHRFFSWCGAIMVLIAVLCIWQRFTPHPDIPGQKRTLGLFGYGQVEIPLSFIRPGLHWGFQYGHWEIHATLINSVVMAGFTLYWILNAWAGRKRSAWSWIVFGSCLITLFFARSAWALVVLALGFLWYYRLPLLHFAKRYQKIALIGIAFCGLGFVALLAYKFYPHTENGVRTHRYHANSRIYYWQTALRMWRAAPLSGVGLGAFGIAYPHFKHGAAENTIFAHGWPFQLLSETGTLGTVGFIGLGLAWWRAKRKSSGKTTSLQKIAGGTLGMALLFGAIGIPFEYFLNRYVAVLFFAALWLDLPIPTVKPRRLWLYTGICGLLLLSVFWLSMRMASSWYLAGMSSELQGNEDAALQAYAQAIALQSSHADSHARIAVISYRRYLETQNPADLQRAQAALATARHYKKDIRYAEIDAQ